MYTNSFPVDRPVVQQQRYDPNNPPFAPQINTAQWIQPFVPYLSGLMMDMITQGAQGPLSMHFYNHMVQNNWANEDFAREVANAADFVFLKTSNMQPQSINPGQAFVELVPAYLQLRTIFEAEINNSLWNYVDANDKWKLQQDIVQFKQLLQSINNLRNGGQQQPAQMNNQMQGGNRGYPTPMGNQNAYQGQQGQQPQQNMAYTSPVGNSGKGPGGGRDYGNTAPTVAAQPMQMQPAPMAYAPPAPQSKGPTMPASMPSGTLVTAEQVTWKPSEDRPYPMAYNPARIKMMYTLENGNTIPTPAHNTDINMISYDRHNITTLFGLPPANLPVVRDNSDLVNRLSAGIDKGVEEESDVDASDLRKEETLGLRAVITANSLESAIYDARTEMLAKTEKDSRPMLFQAYAHVYRVLIGDKSEYELLAKFADSSSYIELREKLRAAGASGSPELITSVGLVMVDLLNSILHKNLSILPVELTVDDFCNDLDELLRILKANYSDRMYNAFLNDQSLRIKSVLVMPDVTQEAGKHVHDLMAGYLLTQSWENREDVPSFTFFGSTVRMSFINMLSHDLQVAGMPRVGNILTNKYQPALYKLAEAVFASDNSGMLVARQLVITIDGRILELSRGSLIEGACLVSLVK